MDSGFLKQVTFGGFDKKDVLNYIDELNGKVFKLEEDAAAANAQITSLRQELAKAQQQLNEEHSSSDRETQLEAELNRERQLANQYKASVDNLTDELIRQKSAAAAKEREIVDLTLKLREVKEKAQSYEEKNQQFQSTASNIGGILIDARCMADEIVEKAKQKSEQILAQSALDKGALQNQLSVMVDRMAEVSHSIESFYHDGMKSLDEMKHKLTHTGETMSIDIEEKPAAPKLAFEPQQAKTPVSAPVSPVTPKIESTQAAPTNAIPWAYKQADEHEPDEAPALPAVETPRNAESTASSNEEGEGLLSPMNERPLPTWNYQTGRLEVFEGDAGDGKSTNTEKNVFF